MASFNPTGSGPAEPSSAADEDAIIEMAVLAIPLDEHPAQLTLPELSLALNAERDDFEAVDAVERAVRELVGAGLLHSKGGFVVPTRALLNFTRLEIE